MLERLVPNPEWLSTLKWLGQYDWVRIESMEEYGEIGFVTTWRFRWPDRMPLAVRRHAGQFQKATSYGDHSVWSLYALSKGLQTGPKLIRPQFDHCVALAHTDVTLSPTEYKQPYPYVIVELPDRWQQMQANRFGTSGHQYVIVYHHEESGHIYCQANHRIRPPCTVVISPHRNTIEDALAVPPGREDTAMAVLDERIGINICLMMTVYGVHDAGPVYRLNKKKPRKKRKRDFEKDRATLIARGVNLLRFDQEVVFYDRKPYRDAESDHEPSQSGPRKPHWRRGHFRRVPCGKGRNDRRIVFIRPTFVGRHLFEGDPGDTSTTYLLRGQSEGQR